jgi:hypothetical protein
MNVYLIEEQVPIMAVGGVDRQVHLFIHSSSEKKVIRRCSFPLFTRNISL